MKDVNIARLIDLYGKLLTKRQMSVLEDYYDFDLSLSEIGANYGISRQTAYEHIKNAESLLVRYESALGLDRKIGALKADLAAVRTVEDAKSIDVDGIFKSDLVLE